jgi:hypothetical protein
MYKFQDHEGLKTAIRQRLTDDLAQEANICFDFAILLFKQLMEIDMPKYIEEADEPGLG